MKIGNLIIAIVAFIIWAWMWHNAEKVTKKIPRPVAWLFHIWLAGTWVMNAFAAFGAK